MADETVIVQGDLESFSKKVDAIASELESMSVESSLSSVESAMVGGRSVAAANSAVENVDSDLKARCRDLSVFSENVDRSISLFNSNEDAVVRLFIPNYVVDPESITDSVDPASSKDPFAYLTGRLG